MHISDQKIPEKPSLEIHPDVLLQRPHLAALIGPIVANWADIEGKLEAIFLLCTTIIPRSPSCRTSRDGMRERSSSCGMSRHAKGIRSLSNSRAILRHVAQPAGKRHDVAHGIWALCKELPDDLVIASPAIYTSAMQQALRAQAEGAARFLVDKDVMLATARVVTTAHLELLLGELREARSLLNTFMIEKTPAIVDVNRSEALPRAADHPEVAARIRNAEAGVRKRDKGRRNGD